MASVSFLVIQQVDGTLVCLMETTTAIEEEGTELHESIERLLNDDLCVDRLARC